MVGGEQSAFQNLRVWQSAMKVSRLTYKYTAQLPLEEQFGLISQMRRCAVSIPSNIAEGARRGSKKEFKQFLRIAAGSAAELETQSPLAEEFFFITAEDLQSELIKAQKMLESLMQKL